MYFLGAIFPFFALVLGIVLIIVGLAEPGRDMLAVAGAILVGFVTISFSLGSARAQKKE